jgi:S-adenosylmethionine:tRNA ribosyltransferase-isomerase
MAQRDLSKLITHTRLIIAPGYTFRILDGLFTNFHQPGSTLILLIAAILGDDWRQVYAHALANNYRFLSYGDANLYFIPKAGKA